MWHAKASPNGDRRPSTRRGISFFLVLALLVPHGEVRRHASVHSRHARTRPVCHQLCFSEFLHKALTLRRRVRNRCYCSVPA